MKYISIMHKLRCHEFAPVFSSDFNDDVCMYVYYQRSVAGHRWFLYNAHTGEFICRYKHAREMRRHVKVILEGRFSHIERDEWGRYRYVAYAPSRYKRLFMPSCVSGIINGMYKPGKNVR